MAETAQSNAMTDAYKWLHHHFPHFVDCRPIDMKQQLEGARFRLAGSEPMSIWGLSVVSVVALKPA